MEDNKELVTDVTENVEGTTEQTGVEEVIDNTPIEAPKTYTDAEVDEIVKTRLGRQERKLTKKFEKELSAYKEAESVLNAGLGTSDITEATNNLKEFYKNKGVEMPNKPSYSDSDMKILANAEAQEIISLGFDDVVDEVDRLAEIGFDNMTPREKLVFTQLAEYRKSEQEKKELASVGISEEALKDKDFIEFAKNLNPNMSTKDKYEMYTKYRPKPKVETIGSMKSSTGANDQTVKEFYTRDEALKFTRKDYANTPGLQAAVEKSMLKWK